VLGWQQVFLGIWFMIQQARLYSCASISLQRNGSSKLYRGTGFQRSFISGLKSVSQERDVKILVSFIFSLPEMSHTLTRYGGL
jgi:hypothetical protein